MNKSIEEFAKWLGLQVGHRYKFKTTGKEFLVSRDYNIYYDGAQLGESLNSITLYDLLNIEEVR